jgi:SulP family sulfate permease
VTAILSGLIIGGLSGAPYQISGPTGAMSAVLILIANKHGVEGVWLAGVLSGLLILLMGIFRLGRVVSLIPRPVITGFTSGIAIIIFVGQLHTFLGIKASESENAIGKLIDYLRFDFAPDWRTMLTAGIVIATIFLMPKSINKRLPGSLVGLVIASAIAIFLGWQEKEIGDIPRTLLLDERLRLNLGFLAKLPDLILPTLSIAALGSIESLLCGAVCGNATGKSMDGDQELIAQGVGNLLIPFFGGVPATAAIARSSVGVSSGGQTRMVSIIHALLLLACVFVLGPIIARVPLAALAGVLMATAIRMNEWSEIKWMFRHQFKSAIAAFFVTMFATAWLDLTQAILIGMLLSALIFVYRASAVSVERKEVDVKTLQSLGHDIDSVHPDMSVIYITGPMFFGAAESLRRQFNMYGCERAVVLSMRGVPLIDVSGLELIEEFWEKQKKCDGELLFAAVQPAVKQMLDRSGLTRMIGEQNFFWSADKAILAANARATQ